MKIAFISYEYPPDTAFGGIATYVRQAAILLAARNHDVEVFTASCERSGSFRDGKILVHVVAEVNRRKFAEAIAPVFSIRHAFCNFDVVESPDFNADGHVVRRLHPNLAHVVKLHTPSELIARCSISHPEFRGWLGHHLIQTRMLCGALRRARRPLRYLNFKPNHVKPLETHRIERDYARSADMVVSPSKSLADWAIKEWSIAPSRTMVVPNPYIPADRLLNIPTGSEGNVVGFFGRLEQRKGVADLVEAIPLILKAEPKSRFRFVGKPDTHPGTLERYDLYIMRRLQCFHSSIEMVGGCAPNKMPEEYRAVNVCVFPSIWENFPNVCLEAMAAGRAIVASSAGGMAEMLKDGVTGRLVAPHAPKQIAEAVIQLLRSPAQCRAMGDGARQRVVATYDAKTIGPQLELSYESAMLLNNKRIISSNVWQS